MVMGRALMPWRLLAVAAALFTVSAAVSWDKIVGVPHGAGWFVGFLDGPGLSVLRWEGLSPQVTLRWGMVAAAWMLVVLVRLRPRLGAALTLTLALGFALVLGAGNPAPWPWSGPSSGLRIVPGAGYWLALSGLSLTLLGAATGFTRRRR